ncbi:MAG: T9SS type A sorting domain-containing protein [Crocinitomicaceae bacterium]|nr:T9SS type A sorting domain-containing protein [Crocinitomicaceae bacterium]
MFKSILALSIVVIMGTFSNNVNSQVVFLATDLTNPPATSCTITMYTVSGTLANTNYGYSGPAVVVTGFNITVDMEYFSGFNPIVGLTPFTEDINLGTLPEGAYNITTTGIVDGIVSNVDLGSFSVETCCAGSVDLGGDSTICDTTTLILDATTSGASYNWQDGSSSSTFAVDSSGIYWVEMTDTNGCVYTDSVTISVINCSLGLEQISNPVSFTLYPNPAVSTFQILGLKKDSKVSIFTLTGELVDFKRTNNTIDVSQLENGIYYISVELNGSSQTKRIIISN